MSLLSIILREGVTGITDCCCCSHYKIPNKRERGLIAYLFVPGDTDLGIPHRVRAIAISAQSAANIILAESP